MVRRHSVNLGNLVLSLSDAMDLATPDLIQHQQRTAFTVWKMCKADNCPDRRLEKSFSAALLHDIGAFSLEEKVSLRSNQGFEAEDLMPHCVRGETLLKDMPWLRDAAPLIRNHHRDWRDWLGSTENDLAFDSQLIYLGDYLERSINRDQHILLQQEGLRTKVQALSGSGLNPRIVDIFLAISDREEFWLDLVSPRLYSILLNEGPFRQIEIEVGEVLRISELFRNIIDFRSRFTSTHSSGVAASASMLARIFGLTDTETVLMEVAGNLHDIGKLAIPNSILEKPGKLTDAEMAIMRSHTYHTYSVIDTIGGLKQVTEWAAYHHEKLDGSGYPFHCKANEIGTGSRILMVADIFTALSEDRPYRKGMSKDNILKILKQSADDGLLDARIVNLLVGNYDEIIGHVSEKQAETRDFYEKQFTGPKLPVYGD